MHFVQEIIEQYFEKKEINSINLTESFYNVKGKIYQKVVKKGKVVGYFVALSKDNIGFSFCNPIDRFNKEYALKLALYRAINKINLWENIPFSYKPDLIKFLSRVERYYKA